MARAFDDLQLRARYGTSASATTLRARLPSWANTCQAIVANQVQLSLVHHFLTPRARRQHRHEHDRAGNRHTTAVRTTSRSGMGTGCQWAAVPAGVKWMALRPGCAGRQLAAEKGVSADILLAWLLHLSGIHRSSARPGSNASRTARPRWTWRCPRGMVRTFAAVRQGRARGCFQIRFLQKTGFSIITEAL